MGDVRRWLAGVAASALLLGAGQAQAAPAYDAAAWKADYAQLKAALEKDYANMAWFGSFESGVDVPRLDKATQAALAAARTDDEAKAAIGQFVAGFHDGHFSSLATQIPAPPNAVVPVEHPSTFTADDPVTGCAGLGFLPSAPIAFSVPFEALPGFKLSFDGMNSVYRAGVAVTSDGTKIGVIRIQNFRMRAFPGVCALAWSSLVAAHTPITSLAVRDAAYALWFDAFSDEIKALQAQGATAIIVDVGNNSGGDDTADYFPRMLTDRLVHSSRLRVIPSGAGLGYLQEQAGSYDEPLSHNPPEEARLAFTAARTFYKAAVVTAQSDHCDLSWVWHERRHWDAMPCKRLVDAGYAGGWSPGLPRGAFGNKDLADEISSPSEIDHLFGAWTGPVYVLTDGKSYSSAEMFTAAMVDNHIAKTVGARTGGDGCGFMGDSAPLVLGHSHLRYRMPNCMRLRADGTSEVAGIAADIPIVPYEGEEAVQRSARLLDTVEKDMKGK